MDELWANNHSYQLDYLFPKELVDTWGLKAQTLPQDLAIKPNETLADYQNRYYFQARIPTRISAFNDLKLINTDIFSIFISDAVRDLYSQMPHEVRVNKKLFYALLKNHSPDVSHSMIDSPVNLGNYLRIPSVRKQIESFLTDSNSENILPQSFINYILNQIDSQKSKKVEKRHSFSRIMKKRLKIVLPQFLLKIKPKKAKELDPFVMALRTIIILRMNVMLQNDASFFSQKKAGITI